MKFKILVLILYNLAWLSSNAQIIEEEIEQNIEIFLEEKENETELTDLIEHYKDKTYQKTNLNTSSYQDLENFDFLKPKEIQAILNHRKKFGNFVSIYELQAVEGLNLEKIKILLPYVSVEGSWFEFGSKDKLTSHKNTQIILQTQRKIEKAAGYLAQNDTTKPKYLGDNFRHVMRIKSQINPFIKIGLNAEKDAGEPFFNSYNPKGFDFYTGYVQYQNKNGIVKQIILGDYNAAFGQGLTFGSGLAFGKGLNIYQIKRNQHGFRSSNSLNEALYLRGIAVNMAYKKINFHTWFSKTKLDAIERGFDTLANESIFGIQSTGLHRTIAELESKNKIDRQVIGSNIQLNLNKIVLNYTVLGSSVSGKIQKPNELYHQFIPSSPFNFRQGFSFQYAYKNSLSFAEVSMQNNNSISYMFGTIWALGKNLDLSFLHRSFAKNANYDLSNAISESSSMYGEKGNYIGISGKLNPNLQFTSYLDVFQYDWLKYLTDAPSVGSDYFLEVQYVKRKYWTLSLRYKSKLNERNIRSNLLTEPFAEVTAHERSNIRIHFTSQIDLFTQLRLRAEWSRFSSPWNMFNEQKGYFAYADLNRKIASTKIYFRYAVFNINGFDARIYSFENDLPYSFSVPFFSDSGTRFYIQIKTQIIKNLELWVRYSQTNFYDKEAIGSGNEKIEGNKISEIKAMCKYSF